MTDHETNGDIRPHHRSTTSLLEEIRALEARLAAVGLDGDCAYERALSQIYDRLLRERRDQLAAIRCAGF